MWGSSGDGRRILESSVRGVAGSRRVMRSGVCGDDGRRVQKWQGSSKQSRLKRPSPGEPTKTVLSKLSCILDCSFKMIFRWVSSLICSFSSIRRSCKLLILIHLEQMKTLVVKSSSGMMTNMSQRSHFITFRLSFSGPAEVMLKNSKEH